MAQFTSQDPDKIVSEIAKRVAGVARPIVAIDGRVGVGVGAGKSRLAKLVARRLNALHVDLDSYVAPEAAYSLGYIANLQFDAFRRDFDRARGGVILSGACVRDALYGLGRDATVHAYVKCWNTFLDCWDDEEACDLASMSDVPGDVSPLERELMEYHTRWQPHRRAAVEWHNAGESLPARTDRQRAGLNDKLALRRRT
jgi:hypothetical protein